MNTLRFARTAQLIGFEGMDKLKQARVAVCGLGAVGSFAVEALARSGIGYLRLIDFDTVSESNINRQLLALDDTVGLDKTKVASDRVKSINPECETDIRQVKIDTSSLPELITEDLDAVVDAIDSVSSKVSLIIHTKKMPRTYIVSSMGAASRFDPDGPVLADIKDSHSCPLARVIRHKLHRNGIYEGVRCVFSPEPAHNKKAPLIEEPVVNEFAHQRPPIGSMSYVTGIFGLKAAGDVIRHLLGQNNSIADEKKP